MSEMTLADLSEKMSDIDFAMLVTKSSQGELASRPMSNNGDVKYEGTSYFFAYAETRTVSDISADPKVALTMQGSKGLFGSPPLFLAIEGHAELIRDKAAFAEHWDSDLDYWFEQGIDTPGIVLIKVGAKRIHYWNGKDEGDIVV